MFAIAVGYVNKHKKATFKNVSLTSVENEVFLGKMVFMLTRCIIPYHIINLPESPSHSRHIYYQFQVVQTF